MGAEIDLLFKPFRWLELTGMFSYGDWQWDSNATGYWYNSAGQPVADNKGTVASGIQAADHAKSVINLKGVKVGGSAIIAACTIIFCMILRFRMHCWIIIRDFCG